MSAANILPLLNQLQIMDSTLTNFMLETILKLQSLVNGKVFLLIDSDQNRRYCGSKALTDAFEGKGLICSKTSDIAVQLDTATNSLVESPALFSTTMSDVSIPMESLYAPVVSDIPDTRVQSVPPASMTTGNAVELFSYADSRNGPKRKKRKKLDDVIPINDTKLLSSSTELCKNEQLDEIQEFVISDDDCGGNDRESVSYLMVDTVNDISPAETDWRPPGNAEGKAEREEETDVVPSFYSGTYPVIEPQFFFDVLPDVDREIQKYNALMKVKNPVALYQKDTVESKLLKSVSYSVGKNAALKCPHPFSPENKEALLSHKNHYADLFLGQCANAGLVFDKRSIGEKLDLLHKTTTITHVRRSVKDGFKRVAHRYQSINQYGDSCP